jgi:23S rRNA (cytosine1962-C5)-methyltransferase
MSEKKVILQKGKEKFVKCNRHPWIFSGAIASFPQDLEPGECASVYSHAGEFLAIAYFHQGHSLAGRILSFEKKSLEHILEESISKALFYRKQVIDFSQTDSFRWINAEQDGLSGLIIDVYKDVVVLQISTLGMEKLRSLIIETIQRHYPFRSLYEKSTSSCRIQEGLSLQEGLLQGDLVEEVVIKENGISYLVSITKGQKTGFFLDQREMRRKIGQVAKGKKVLNCFSYSGGFSLSALQGGAVYVTSVDSCPNAISLALRNTELNDFPLSKHRAVQADVFDFLEKEDISSYDVIIIDPPAFAKKRQDVEGALRAYRELSYKAIKECKAGAFLLICSCSYFVEESAFQQMLFQASSLAGRDVKIIHGHIRAMDHFVSLYHPEGDYLKSFLLWVA